MTPSLSNIQRRMISLASAPGWKARYAAEEKAGGPRVVTLISWALVEDSGGVTEIVGVVQRTPTPETPNGLLALADEVDGFEGYTFTGLMTRASENQPTGSVLAARRELEDPRFGQN